ncbi:MAG: long-chain fatty acid--CoA ligase [Bryobacterales bacterium]
MPDTLSRLFRRAISYDKPDAILAKHSGQYQPISSRELYRRVGKLHLALRNVGVGKGDRCAILSENRWEWAVADFALMTAGAVSVPIYATLTPEQIQYMLEHSECRLIFVSSPDQLEKVRKIWKKLPNLEGAVLFDRASSGEDERIIRLSKLVGDTPLTEEEIQQFETAMSRIEPDDLASLIYTSGTTGAPKGVMLTHRNFCSSVDHNPLQLFSQDVCLSFLPLSHVAERVADYIFYNCGATVAYAESIDAVPQNMQEVRPTVALSVPRFFEKVHAKVMAAVAVGSPTRRRLFEWALATGEQTLPFLSDGQAIPFGLNVKVRIADMLVFRKLRGRMGGRFRLFVSGSAPLARHLAEFFTVIGVPIYEAYGLTETTAIVSMNTPESWRFGTVGQVTPNNEVRIAEDGEILVRGDAIMQGYYKLPEVTAEVLQDGWFSTGDIGKLDKDGFLSITDRKKDLFKTSGGKYIAPAPIENHLKTSPYISMAVVVAEGRNFPSAIIIPDFDKLKQWAKENGIEFRNHTELVADTRIKLFMEAEVQRVVDDLARYEKPKKIVLLDRDLTIENGEITPTMKVRRRAVEAKFARQIDALYT